MAGAPPVPTRETHPGRAVRRAMSDDGLSAEVTADFVVSLLRNGLLPR